MRSEIMLLSALMIASAVFAEGNGEKRSLSPIPEEDAIKLVKADLGEEVMIAWAKSLKPYARLSREEIIRLKKHGVAESVIAVLIRRGGRPSATKRKKAQVREQEGYQIPSAAPSNSDKQQVEILDKDKSANPYCRQEAVQYKYIALSNLDYSRARYHRPNSYSRSYFPFLSYGHNYYPRRYHGGLHHYRHYGHHSNSHHNLRRFGGHHRFRGHHFGRHRSIHFGRNRGHFGGHRGFGSGHRGRR